MNRSVLLVFALATICVAGAPAQSAPSGSTKRPPAAKRAAPSKAGASSAASPGSASQQQKLPSEQTVNEFMRRMFGYDQTIRWKVTQIASSEAPDVAQVTVTINDQPRPWTLYVTPDGQHAFVGEMIPFGADPFAPVRKKLEVSAKGPTKGPQNAAVTIVDFSDLQCPHCKQAQPVVERLVADVPNTKLVFENFPLEQIHKWANLGARYVDCIGRNNPDAVWQFINGVFTDQDQITEQNAPEKFKELAKAGGLDLDAISTCAESAQAKADVIQSYELGASLGITGTPTLFINGRRITNVNQIPYDQLKAIVQFEAQPGEKAQTSGN